MSKYRNFVFTFNNYTPEDELYLEQLECRYVVYGYERAPTSGTPHLQGFVSFENPRSLRAIIKLLKGCHVERAIDSVAAIAYCKKGGEFTERGDPPADSAEKGKQEKERWKRIRQACENKQYADLPDDFLCRHTGAFTAIRRLFLAQHVPPALSRLENYWYHGPSGAGKSVSARKFISEQSYSHYLKDCTKWWDGYEHEDVVLLEELGPQHIPALTELLKKWADYYPYQAEVKGGYLLIRPKIIIVTTNYSIDELFSTSHDREPINRRFNCVEFTL